MSNSYRVKRADRASLPVSVGDTVYPGADFYGCANEDTRNFGGGRIEYTAMSKDPSGVPFFTIPKADIEKIEPAPALDFHNCGYTWCLVHLQECLGKCGRPATPAGVAELMRKYR